QQLKQIADRVGLFVSALYATVLDDILPVLAAHGLRVVAFERLPARRQQALGGFFREEVLPVLTPLAVDPSRAFPLLSSLSLNLVVLLAETPDEPGPRIAVVQVPSRLPRLVHLDDPDGVTFVPLESVIRAHLRHLFPGQAVRECGIIRLTRDAELEFDDEGGRTHLELVEREVRRRRRSDVVRLEVEDAASPVLVQLLRDRLEIDADDVYAVPGPLDLRALAILLDVPGRAELRDPPVQPASVLAAEHHRDLFAVLDERDLLLHHPYDSYDPVLSLFAQAADDPDVLAIRMTLYRASAGSPLIASLRRAADQNKQVTVIVELTARFDEERNIGWARALEEAGAHVIYGVRGFKVHAKVALIVRRTPRGLRRYVHLGTGNYNERTARVYTDFSLMTAADAVTGDASAFFNALTGYSDPPRLKKLVMAPTALRQRLLKLIDRERRRASAGQPAEILAKMNSLLDGEIIEALYAASIAGVRIALNVRGICGLRPGVPGVSQNIEVVSIVDRFLEHSRIFYFHNAGDEEVYLSSADWMSRNLDKRVELMFPVPAGERARVLRDLRAMFRDNVKARLLNPDGTYVRREAGGDPPFRVQEQLQREALRSEALERERAGVHLVPEEGGGGVRPLK
ncbi:MAG TPA: polyphosphate kinase 1, partial [Vicinamibacterales bacterium]|nr:polyphosphate kinase 1 [Vicinamibacterales bacterium]